MYCIKKSVKGSCNGFTSTVNQKKQAIFPTSGHTGPVVVVK